MSPVPPVNPTTRVRATAARRRRRKPDPSRAWAKGLERSRPGLLAFVLDALEARYGRSTWARVHDPTSELVLTILAQNSADVNAEQAFESLRTRFPGGLTPQSGAGGKDNRPGWGGLGLERTAAPDWLAVEVAPIEDLVEAIRPGGLAQQKAPRIQNALRRIREVRGDHSLEFLADLAPLQARAWLTEIDGVGRKTASVVLLFSFGMPLMPVDRHVERVSKRIGLLPSKSTADEAHEYYLAMLAPEQAYDAHVGLITHGRMTCHAQRPTCDACPIAPRCRFIDRRAP